MIRRLALLALGLSVPAVGSAQLGPPPPPMASQDAPQVLKKVGFDQHLGEKIPLDLAFKDETGRDVRLADYFGKRPVVLSLVYYRCPMLCTISLNGLARALKVLSFVPGQEFEVLTVSFDPNERPALAAAKKKVYMTALERPEADRGWHFLTGPQDSVTRLTKAVGFRYVWDEATRQFAHPAGILVLAPDGTITNYLFGVEYSPKDLRLALVSAADGKIGNAVDTVLLYCFQYDPRAGTYSASILNIVRAGGILTVLAMAGFVLAMAMRHREPGASGSGESKS
jgi:protein SCO1/2